MPSELKPPAQDGGCVLYIQETKCAKQVAEWLWFAMQQGVHNAAAYAPPYAAPEPYQQQYAQQQVASHPWAAANHPGQQQQPSWAAPASLPDPAYGLQQQPQHQVHQEAPLPSPSPPHSVPVVGALFYTSHLFDVAHQHCKLKLVHVILLDLTWKARHSRGNGITCLLETAG